MKPRLGRKVYCVDDYAIILEPVYAIGKNSFLLDPFVGGKDLESIEWKYNDYNKTWFTNLSKAKCKLLENYKFRKSGANCRVVKVDDDYWELRQR